MSNLQFRFDPNQDYQLEAIQAVVDVFEGLPRSEATFTGADFVPNVSGYAAYDMEDTDWLHQNVRRVQEQHGIAPTPTPTLEVDEGMMLEDISNDSMQYPHFTIEMETGTGKTYVYLRTIYELYKHYGFRKFVIVVPSIAIFEGVIKSFNLMESHFAGLYGNEPVHLVRYDGARLSTVKNFARSTFVEIMVMTIAAFNTKSNNIYKASEQLPGELLPYEYLQVVRPILILDEPQSSATTDKAKAALRTLNPLFALRYSATHIEKPNLLYQLTPFEAYQRNLVKKIQVDGVTERDNFNRPFLALERVERPTGRSKNGAAITATVRTYVMKDGQAAEEEVTLKQGDDLFAKTGRDEHRHGYVVEEINVWNASRKEGELVFAAETLRSDDVFGPTKQEIFRVEIERTVQHHMAVQEKLHAKGIKVLSLFFIDRVANYVEDDGIIRTLFENAFERLKKHYPYFEQFQAARVHDGYFARSKPTKKDPEEYAIDTTGRTKAERAAEQKAFELIMRQKEQLLSFGEPVAFVFAHSALKEGWDNPNVFQICTLNQTVSERKKRQEIGRGLRLAVNQDGERSFDDAVNVLTVVANESYHNYVAGLQEEYVEEGHAQAPPKPTNARRHDVQRNDALFQSSLFQGYWERLASLTEYAIQIDTDVLIEECLDRLNNKARFPQPKIVVERGRFVQTQFTLTLHEVRNERVRLQVYWENSEKERSDEVRMFERRDDLSRLLNERRLRGFKIDEIVDDGEESRIIFSNKVELRVGESYRFDTQDGQSPQERVSLTPDQGYPVFNLIERTARETDLTRPTINTIFRRMRADKKEALLKNPEGFAGVFISEIRNTLADHIVERLEFVVAAASGATTLEELFPPTVRFPQRELVEAGASGLYDEVQIDSDVEERFVRQRLSTDANVIAFFKFPAKFKIRFPKIIGNYNPDWGILRRSDDGHITLELVRETKGTAELERLQFPHERRKIRAAERHFEAIGVDYRVITDECKTWWMPAPSTQESLFAE